MVKRDWKVYKGGHGQEVREVFFDFCLQGLEMRRAVESTFSCYKQRRFGVFVRATKFENIVKDVVLNCLVQILIMSARL